LRNALYKCSTYLLTYLKGKRKKEQKTGKWRDKGERGCPGPTRGVRVGRRRWTPVRASRSQGTGFIRVKWTNQQCQSTEGR